jgi:hypothetical protein
MKNYISKIPTDNGFELRCNHPKVTSIHRWGGGGVNSIQSDYVTLKFSNGVKIDFEDFGNNEAITEAEKYLNSLSF